MKMFKIYFFGDSICFGQHVAIHNTWVVLISQKIYEYYQNHGIQIVTQNPSINGNTSRMALERLQNDVIEHSPEIVLVQFGLNDCNYWMSAARHPRVSPSSFKENLCEIIERCISANVKKIILNTNHQTCKANRIENYSGIAYEDSNLQYNKIIRNVSDIYSDNVVLIDMEKEFEKLTNNSTSEIKKYLMPDGIHLNEKGHREYIRIIYPILLRETKSCIY